MKMANNKKSNFVMCSNDNTSSICLPSFKSNYKQHEEHDFPFGDTLGSIYPILERILHYLPYTDLRNITQISNKDWKDAAICSLKKRQNMCWFSLQEENSNLQFQSSPNLAFENREYLFLMYNKQIKDIRFNICVHKDGKSTNKVEFMEYLEENIIEWELMNSCILGTCYVCPLFEANAAVTNSWFSAITIPQINNVTVVATSNCPDCQEDVLYLNNGEKFIGLMVFTIGNSRRGLKKFLYDILDDQPCNEIALIGGVADSVFTSVHAHELFESSSSFLCIGFVEYAKSTCKAYSIVFRKADNFETSIIKFREGIDFQRNNFLIKLTDNQEKAKLEDTIIRKYFPNIPMLGMYAFYACGWNKFPQNEGTDSDSIFDRFKDMFKLTNPIYSTALMLLSWDN